MSLHFTDDDRMRRLPKLPFILKARFVSKKAEYVPHVSRAQRRYLTWRLSHRAKIKEAGGVVKLIA